MRFEYNEYWMSRGAGLKVVTGDYTFEEQGQRSYCVEERADMALATQLIYYLTITNVSRYDPEYIISKLYPGFRRQ